jgi:hypothetical protein
MNRRLKEYLLIGLIILSVRVVMVETGVMFFTVPIIDPVIAEFNAMFRDFFREHRIRNWRSFGQ